MLANIQKHLENPFNQVGEDDIQINAEKFADRLSLEGRLTGVYLHVGARTFIELFEGNPAPAPKDASYKHICLEVDEIEAAIAELSARGIEATDKKLGSDNSWQAWLTDPDGNRIELHAFTPESKQVAALKRLEG